MGEKINYIIEKVSFENITNIFNILVQIIIYFMILCLIAKFLMEFSNFINLIYFTIKDFLKIFFNPYGLYDDNSVYNIINTINPSNDITTNDIMGLLKGNYCSLYILYAFNFIVILIFILLLCYILFKFYQIFREEKDKDERGINDFDINKFFLYLGFLLFIFSYLCYNIYYYLYKKTLYKRIINTYYNIEAIDIKINEYIYINNTPKQDNDFKTFYSMLKNIDTNKDTINNYFNNLIENNYEKDILEYSNILSKRLLLYDIFNYFNYISLNDNNFEKIEKFFLKTEDIPINFCSLLDNKEQKLINKYHQELELFINLENNDTINDEIINKKQTYINKSINYLNNNLNDINDSLKQIDTTSIIYIYILLYIIIIFIITVIFLYYFNNIIIDNADKFLTPFKYYAKYTNDGLFYIFQLFGYKLPKINKSDVDYSVLSLTSSIKSSIKSLTESAQPSSKPSLKPNEELKKIYKSFYKEEYNTNIKINDNLLKLDINDDDMNIINEINKIFTDTNINNILIDDNTNYFKKNIKDINDIKQLNYDDINKYINNDIEDNEWTKINDLILKYDDNIKKIKNKKIISIYTDYYEQLLKIPNLVVETEKLYKHYKYKILIIILNILKTKLKNKIYNKEYNKDKIIDEILNSFFVKLNDKDFKKNIENINFDDDIIYKIKAIKKVFEISSDDKKEPKPIDFKKYLELNDYYYKTNIKEIKNIEELDDNIETKTNTEPNNEWNEILIKINKFKNIPLKDNKPEYIKIYKDYYNQLLKENDIKKEDIKEYYYYKVLTIILKNIIKNLE